VDGWMGGWVDGWMGGWVDGWMGGWVDGRGTGVDGGWWDALLTSFRFDCLDMNTLPRPSTHTHTPTHTHTLARPRSARMGSRSRAAVQMGLHPRG